jgi:hypothetical protein
MKKLIEDKSLLAIQTYIASPSTTVLTVAEKKLLDKLIDASNFYNEHPVKKIAAMKLKIKHDCTMQQAYVDIDRAVKMFPRKIDKEFLFNWGIENIIALIKRCEISGDTKNWAAASATLFKALGDPNETDKYDPRLYEQHKFYITMNFAGQDMKVDMKTLINLPEATRAKVISALGNKIDRKEAKKLINS